MIDSWTISDGYLKLIEKWKETGKKYIYPQKIKYWEDAVEDRAINDSFYGKDIECALIIMKALDENKTLGEVAQIINAQMHKTATYFQYTNKLVLEYSKRGPEYYRAFAGKNSNLISKYVKQIEYENKQFKKELNQQSIK